MLLVTVHAKVILLGKQCHEQEVIGTMHLLQGTVSGMTTQQARWSLSWWIEAVCTCGAFCQVSLPARRESCQTGIWALSSMQPASHVTKAKPSFVGLRPRFATG